jgi:Trp operon repressor
MDDIIIQLNDIRHNNTTAAWKTFTQACQTHPIVDILIQDPFTYRAYKKPRGYAGDAVMMDYLYASGKLLEKKFDFDLTKTGQEIMDYTLSMSPAKSVCARLKILIELLNKIVTSRNKARLLAVASGHLREALHIADQQLNLEEFIAFDQDKESLAVVADDVKNVNIKTVQGSIGDILKNRISLKDFDFIYATGLYDYLDDATATLLTQYLFQALKSEGCLLIPNFMPSMKEIGYMEAFTDWWLIYRNLQMMQKLTGTIPTADIAKLNLYTDPYENIVFLEIHKK